MPEYSIGGRARIAPPKAFQDALQESVRKISVKLEIRWDGLTWTDESQYVLSAKGNFQISGPSGEASSGECDVELDNTTERFNPKNEDSDIAVFLRAPRVAMRLSMDVNNSGYNMRLFTGYIKALSPRESSSTCNLHCFDNLKFLLNKEGPYSAVFINKRLDELIKVLLDHVNEPSLEYDLDEATQVIFGAWFNGEKLIHPLINEMTIAERGRSFFDVYGVFRFWNKNRIRSLEPVTTLTRDNDILDYTYEIAEHNVKNRITVEATPRAADGLQQVWGAADPQIASLSDTLVFIPAQGYQNAWISLEDPAIDWTEPVAVTDYIANSEPDGSGIDLTSSIKVTNFTPYSDAAFLSVRNSSGQNAYFIKFVIRANPVKIYKYTRVIQKEDSSINAYGVKDVKIENDFIDNDSQANAIALEELQRWKENTTNFTVKTKGIPYVFTGDVVNIETADGEIEKFMVSELTFDLTPTKYDQELRLVNPIYIAPTQNIEARAFIVKEYSIGIVLGELWSDYMLSGEP